MAKKKETKLDKLIKRLQDENVPFTLTDYKSLHCKRLTLALPVENSSSLLIESDKPYGSFTMLARVQSYLMAYEDVPNALRRAAPRIRDWLDEGLDYDVRFEMRRIEITPEEAYEDQLRSDSDMYFDVHLVAKLVEYSDERLLAEVLRLYQDLTTDELRRVFSTL